MEQSFRIGQRLSYDASPCTVRYVGKVTGTHGDWLGVEWDDAARGKHSGEANGIQYFTCQVPNSGSFIRPSRRADQTRSFLEAVRYRYATEDLVVINPAVVKIGGKEVENVGFDKIRKQQGALDQLQRIFLDKLCISKATDEKSGETTGLIKSTCPNVTELHLSNNLFETLDEVAKICVELPRLKLLRMDGNRFSSLTLSNISPELRNVLNGIEELSLERTYLSWEQISLVSSYFPNLRNLWLLHNNLTNFDPEPSIKLPESITSINLGFNMFTELDSGLEILARLANLRRLELHHCKVTSISKDGPQFSPSLERVDLLFNEIGDWGFIDQLPSLFPGLTDLTISHNPLFQTFDGAQETGVGDLIVTARLPNLNRLNNSTITPTYRQEAEIYYISLVNQELQSNLKQSEDEILLKHSQYTRLCSLHGSPAYHRAEKEVNPNALATRLIRLHIVSDAKSVDQYMPKDMSIYAMIGQVARVLDLSPLDIRLFQEKRILPTSQIKILPEESAWDSDEDIDDQSQEPVLTNVEIIPSPRAITTLFDNDEVTVIVKEEKRNSVIEM